MTTVDSTTKIEVDIADVNAKSAVWNKAVKALARAKEAESEARAELVKAAFPNGLDEGTNTFDLAGKWKLKVSGVVSRSVDEASLPSILERVREKFEGLDLKDLIKWKPELKVGDYKKLDAKVKKLFDNALVIKGTGDTTPQVKIEESKR